MKKPLILVGGIVAIGVAIFLLFFNPAEAPTMAGSQTVCSEVLAYEIISVPLTCSEDIGNGIVVAMTVAADGTLRVERGDRLIFANPIERMEHMRPNESELIPGSIEFQDVTYDGYQDIIVLAFAGAYNFGYEYYAYDPAEGTYTSKPLLGAVNPYIDTEARTIESFNKGRGMGDIFTTETYLFENGAYVLVHRVMQDRVIEEGDDTAKPQYIYIEEKRQGTELVEVKRRMIPEEEVLGPAQE